MLEKQINKANFENDQIIKTNENLLLENKIMKEEIGALKRLLNKIEEWKIIFFNYSIKHEQLDKEVLKNMLSDFPSSQIIENYETFKYTGYKQNHHNNSMNSREYLLSSFNSAPKNYDLNKNKIQSPEKEIYYSENFLPNNDLNKRKKYENDIHFSSKNIDERQFYSEGVNNIYKRPIDLENITNEEKKYYEKENTNK